MKNINPLGLFDDHFIFETLSKLGNPLQKLNKKQVRGGVNLGYSKTNKYICSKH